MKMRILMALTLLTGCFIAPVAAASVIENLYSIDVPVPSQTPSDRDAALPNAFRDILVKVNGQSSVASEKFVQQSLPKAQSLVREFSYQATPDPKAPLFLKVQFDSHAIDDLLTQAGKSIWGRERPLTLIWLVEKSGSDITITNSESENGLPAALQKNANRRGIPFLLPALDLEDMGHITVADLLKPSIETIRKASMRYHSDLQLIGYVSQIGQHWQGHWTLLYPTDVQNWETSGETSADVVGASIDKLTDKLSTQFSSNDKAHVQSDVIITVSKLDNVEAYAKVVSYLHGLSPVSEIEVISVESTKASFKLYLKSDQKILQQVIGLDNVLLPETESSTKDGLKYQWAS